MKKRFISICAMLLVAGACKNDDPEPEAKRETIYDTTKVIDRYTDSIFHHFYDSVYHHFYDTLTVYDTVRVPILCDHSWVIYNLNNGSDNTDTLNVKNGTSIILKTDASRYGYDFVKWSTSTTGGGNDYNAGDNFQVNKDITLYAIWQSREGLRSSEVYDYLEKQKEGSTVDIKIIDLYPDFDAIGTALKKFWKVNVNLDLIDATEVTDLQLTFQNCTNLKSIILPQNVQNIKNAFWGCSGLTKIDIPSSVQKLELRDLQNLSTLIIPDGVTILSIRDCPKLATINIPNSVSEIGWFSGCSSITEITIPTSVESAELNFSGCTNLKTIKHSLKECAGVNFDGCKNLTSITLPEFRPENPIIAGSAFSGCSKLTSITIPKGVTSFGSGAFSGCSSLTSITIPEGATSIEDVTFYGCSSLSSIIIPENVKSIGMNAFYGCSSLTSITVPENVTSIGSYAFDKCSSLTSLTIKANTPPTLDNWIYYFKTIYVPSSAVNAYKTADGWKDYAEQIVEYK